MILLPPPQQHPQDGRRLHSGEAKPRRRMCFRQDCFQGVTWTKDSDRTCEAGRRLYAGPSLWLRPACAEAPSAQRRKKRVQRTRSIRFQQCLWTWLQKQSSHLKDRRGPLPLHRRKRMKNIPQLPDRRRKPRLQSRIASSSLQSLTVPAPTNGIGAVGSRG